MSAALDAATIDEITTTARRFLSSQWPLQAEHPSNGVKYADAQRLWRSSLELGWPWILNGDDGAVGALRNASSVAALFTVLGRHPAPLPTLSMVVDLPLVAAESSAAALTALLDGETLVTTAFRDGSTSICDGPRWCGIDIVEGRAVGVRTLVAQAGSTESFLVSAHEDGEPVFAVIPAEVGFVRVRPLHCYDRLELPAEVEFNSAPATIVCRGTRALVAAAAIAALESSAVVAELAGIAQGAAELAVAYVKERRQFGRPVGSFQTIKHLLADAWIDVYAVQSVAQALAQEVSEASEPTDALPAARRALSLASSATQRVCEAALQAHGGIGFTLDYPLNWYFNRMLSRTALAGRPSALSIAIGREVLDAARSCTGSPQAAETRP